MVEVIEYDDRIDVIIEVDTSAFEVAIREQPRLRTLSDMFTDSLEAISQPFEMTTDDVLRAFADFP